MKPSDLYAREPKETWTDVSALVGCYYNHVPELENFWQHLKLDRNTKVTIKVYGFLREDTRRFWLLGGVFFAGGPVMIIRNAGREGDDHRSRFITHPASYYDMIKYLASLSDPAPKEFEASNVMSPDQDIEGLGTFYGKTLIDETTERARP
jgi:hypothetical protein